MLLLAASWEFPLLPLAARADPLDRRHTAQGGLASRESDIPICWRMAGLFCRLGMLRRTRTDGKCCVKSLFRSETDTTAVLSIFRTRVSVEDAEPERDSVYALLQRAEVQPTPQQGVDVREFHFWSARQVKNGTDYAADLVVHALDQVRT